MDVDAPDRDGNLFPKMGRARVGDTCIKVQKGVGGEAVPLLSWDLGSGSSAPANCRSRCLCKCNFGHISVSLCERL